MSNPFITSGRFDEENDHDGETHDKADGHGHDDAHGHGEEISAEDWTIQNSMDWYLSPDHLIGHVQDQTFFDFPAFNFKDTVEVHLPNPLGYTNDNPAIK